MGVRLNEVETVSEIQGQRRGMDRGDTGGVGCYDCTMDGAKS